MPFTSCYTVKKALVEKYRNKPGAGKSNPSDNNPDDFYKKWPRDYFSKQNNPHLAAQIETIDEGVGFDTRTVRKIRFI